MKKILLLIILLFPITVKAETKIISHLIDAEIEIAGGLRVKELIVFDGYKNNFSRTINYKMIDEVWNNKTVNLKGSSIYNGYSIENIKVGVIKAPKEIDFNIFSNEIETELKELNPKNIDKNNFTNIKNNLGSTINISHDGNLDKVAFYLDYVISNVIVVHEDVLELNYSFKNLNIGADNTFIRVVIPYGTTSKDYNSWIHGPSNGALQELINSSDEKMGIVAEFPQLKNDVNIRMTLPKEQVGIDVYLNKSNIKALDKIYDIENKKLDKNLTDQIILKIIKYILIILSVLYILGSFIIYKYRINSIFYLYLLLGLIITVFNYIFQYNINFIYLITIFPIIIKIIIYIKERGSKDERKN